MTRPDNGLIEKELELDIHQSLRQEFPKLSMHLLYEHLRLGVDNRVGTLDYLQAEIFLIDDITPDGIQFLSLNDI